MLVVRSPKEENSRAPASVLGCPLGLTEVGPTGGERERSAESRQGRREAAAKLAGRGQQQSTLMMTVTGSRTGLRGYC